MTRKDYVILASALGVSGKNMSNAIWEATLDIICRSLSMNYANFNRVRFESAANFDRTMPVNATKEATK